MEFAWHDFGGWSFWAPNPVKESLKHFHANIKETLSEILNALLNKHETAQLVDMLRFAVQEFSWDGDPEHSKFQLRELAHYFQDTVMKWCGDLAVRKYVLRRLCRTLPTLRCEDLQEMYAEGVALCSSSDLSAYDKRTAADAAVWVRPLVAREGGLAIDSWPAFIIQPPPSNMAELRRAVWREAALQGVPVFRIGIYSFTEAGWKLDGEEGVLRSDRERPYGFYVGQ